MSRTITRAVPEPSRDPTPHPAAQSANGHGHPVRGHAPDRQTRPGTDVTRHGTARARPEALGEAAPDHPSAARQTPPAAAGSVPLQRPGAVAQIRRGRTAAQGVITALALPAPPSPQPTRPLPLPDLHRLPRDTSMLYDISRIDASGRVASLIIVTSLGWQPQDRLELILTEGAIVLRASPEGLFSVQQCLRIVIPAAARRRHAIRPGDYVLLSAAPEYDTVIVYPPSALDDMIARYHAVAHAEGPVRA